MNRTTGQ